MKPAAPAGHRRDNAGMPLPVSRRSSCILGFERTTCQGLAEDFEATGIYGAEGGANPFVPKSDKSDGGFAGRKKPRWHGHLVDMTLDRARFRTNRAVHREPVIPDAFDELARREVAAHALPP